jgi:hypothetical protein
MPLHMTKNYLGRETGNTVLEQRGPNRSIHHRLEWGMIERFPEHYDAVRGDPERVAHVDDVLAMTWTSIRDSYALIDEVLAADRVAESVDATFGDTYYAELDRLTRPLVAKQLMRAEEMVASVWLTAWEDAGRPTLPQHRMFIELPPFEAASEEPSDDPLVLGVLLAVVLLLMLLLVHAFRKPMPSRSGRKTGS